MKTNTQKVVEDYELGTFRWKVRSKSNPNKTHLVSWSEDRGWFCDCKGFEFSMEVPRICNHIKVIQQNYGNKV